MHHNCLWKIQREGCAGIGVDIRRRNRCETLLAKAFGYATGSREQVNDRRRLNCTHLQE